MLMPKKSKFRKHFRGKRRGSPRSGTTVEHGDYGLQALEAAWLTNRQLEAARVAMTRSIKRAGMVWMRVFPDKTYTKKPAETRQGGGKGNPEGWVAVVKRGTILFEMSGVKFEVAKAALTLAAAKLPIRTRIIARLREPVLQ